jgi:predicted MFS family arabinose efflux permease
VPVLPVFFQRNGFTETQIGLLMGIAAVSALFVRPWVGIHVDIKGSRPAILIGQLLLIVSTIGLLGASSFATFFCLRLLFGISLAFYGTGAVTFASSIESSEGNSDAIAIYTLITMLAIGLAMSISQITFDNFGFTTLVIIGLTLIMIAFCVMGLRTLSVKPTAGAIRIPFKAVLVSKVVLATTVCQFAANFAFSAVFTFIPLTALDKGIPFYSLFFISFATFVISSRLFVQRINDILGLQKTIISASLTMMVSVLLLVAAISPAILFLSGALFGLGFGVVFPTSVLLLLSRIDSASRGTALSMLTASGDTGNALSAAILGFVAEHFGYPSLFMTTALIIVLGTYCFHNILAKESHHI